MHNCRIRCQRDGHPNRNIECSAGFYALLFLVWLWGVWGLLLAIPIPGIVNVFNT